MTQEKEGVVEEAEVEAMRIGGVISTIRRATKRIKMTTTKNHIKDVNIAKKRRSKKSLSITIPSKQKIKSNL
jgi:hypothetical protein